MAVEPASKFFSIEGKLTKTRAKSRLTVEVAKRDGKYAIVVNGRVQDGKVVEAWGAWDRNEMFEQFGR